MQKIEVLLELEKRKKKKKHVKRKEREHKKYVKDECNYIIY